MTETETERLEREIAERQERLEQLDTPQTIEAAAELARTDPAAFDRLADERKIPLVQREA